MTNLLQASDIVKQAVKADREKSFDEALDLYNEALKYFVPLLHYEADKVKKQKVRKHVGGYIRRAEELKKLVSNDKAKEFVNHSLGVSFFWNLFFL